jgi:hypothetical protein
MCSRCHLTAINIGDTDNPCGNPFAPQVVFSTLQILLATIDSNRLKNALSIHWLCWLAGDSALRPQLLRRIVVFGPTNIVAGWLGTPRLRQPLKKRNLFCGLPMQLVLLE